MILGPAAVLYVLAARASTGAAPSPEWLVGLASLGFAFSSLATIRSQESRRTLALTIMGVSLGVAMASRATSSPRLEAAHGLAWLMVAALALGLALPGRMHTFARASALGGLVMAALLAALLARVGLLPSHAFEVVVVFGLLASAAVHQLVLTGRGHSVEAGMSAIAIVGLTVGLAYAWFGPFEGLLATVVEIGVALLLWLGHLAWIDPRWRGLRGAAAPLILSSLVCFAVFYAAGPSRALEPWELGAVALCAGVLWWVTFALARRVTKRAIWSASPRVAESARAACLGVTEASELDAVATAALAPFQTTGSDPELSPELWIFEPPLRARLDTANRVSIRTWNAPEAPLRALMRDELGTIIDIVRLRSRIVREPSVRELAELMERRALGALIPCVHLDHLEGLLLLPLEDRHEPLAPVEVDQLGRLGRALGSQLAATLAQRRAESHIHQITELRREAERQVDVLRGEVEQLRQQCDVLGRGLAEDQTLHVAYSPSMRRVQTRAIALAPEEDPVLLVAAAGSPVLPVSRFIHDRGPRWSAPFVVADCAATAPEEVMQLLLGSSEERTGWFESATGGTLLLRDLPALPRVAQSRLAEALCRVEARLEGAAKQLAPPRIIATSRAGMEQLRREGALDPELVRRLEANVVVIPPLRERREDVPSLCLLAVDRACKVLARDPLGIDQAAMGALVDHDWPGDVAELELVIELAADHARTKTITLSDLPPLAWATGEQVESLDGTYLEVERRLLERAIRRAGGNKSQAARHLGMKRTTFLDKLRRHGLEKARADETGESALG
jgi:two-component system response regulator HydG